MREHYTVGITRLAVQKKLFWGNTMQKERIFGKTIDAAGRCEHYHSALDVIANRCAVCNKLYACYKCHDACEAHSFGAVKSDTERTVMCGVCGAYYSYATYSALSSCTHCGARFNPGCALHKSCYVQ